MVGLRFSPGTAEGAFWFWVPGGLIGAWLLNILAKTIETLNIFSLGTGGLTFLGGLFGGTAAMYLYARRKNIPFIVFCDAGALAVPIGNAVGRLACFAGGCCWGAPTESPLGVVYTNALCSVPVHLRGIPLHPVQLYESAGAFILFLILNSVKDKYKGQIFGFYMIGYGILRFCIEFFRPESTLKGPNLPGLSFTQTIILFLLIPAGVWLIAKVRQGKIKVDVQEPVSNLV